jgi:hypothetical protein
METFIKTQKHPMMKKTVINDDKKLKLNKTTIVMLDAEKLSKIWGGNQIESDGDSTYQGCDTTTTPTTPTTNIKGTL